MSPHSPRTPGRFPRDPADHANRHLAGFRSPVHPEPVDRVVANRRESIARLDELAGKDIPPLLAVRDHVDARALLKGDCLVDGAILDPLEFGV